MERTTDFSYSPSMPACKVCASPRRAEIDAQLLSRKPFRQVAAAFGLSIGGLSRHRRHAMKPGTARASAKLDDENLRLAKKLLRSAMKTQRVALSKGETKASLQAIAAAARLIETISKLEAKARGLQPAPVQSESEDIDEIELATIFDRETNHFDPARIVELKAIADAENARFPVLQNSTPPGIQAPEFGDTTGTVPSNE